MSLTAEEKQKLQEKIDQEPSARKDRNEKSLGISFGIIGSLLFPVSVILGTYWMLRGKRARGQYVLMTLAWVTTVNWVMSLLSKSSVFLIDRLL